MEIVWLLDRGCVSSSATASVARVLVVVNLLYRNTRSGLVAGLSAVMVAELRSVGIPRYTPLVRVKRTARAEDDISQQQMNSDG